MTGVVRGGGMTAEMIAGMTAGMTAARPRRF
jgi:hypothetical protein